MASARYWRLSRLESYLGEGLALSDIALYDGASRVDGSATLSCTVTPDSGTMWTETVTWAESSISLPGFAFIWDFGSAQTIDKVGVTGPAQETFAHKFSVEYSTDGATWTLRLSTYPASKFMGAGTPFYFDLALTDQYAITVALLLHGDGTNGSTTITDSSISPKTVTAYGNACISTAQYKFGGSSLYFDGTGDIISVTPLTDFAFGTGDFTIEGWIAMSSGTSNILDMRPNSTTNGGYPVIYCISNTFVYYVNSANRILSGALTAGQLYHVALCRSGTSTKMFIEGTQVGSTYTDSNDYLAGSFTLGGSANNNANYAGYIDELRITKGVARYTANFTPPTAEFSDAISFDTTPLRPRLPAVAAFVGSSAIGDTQITAPSVATIIDLEDGGMHRVTGTVKEKASPSNTPLHRKVRLHREPDGRLIREAWSDAETGEYSFDYIRGDVNYFVTAFDYLHNYRAVIADNLTPEAMP